MSKSTILQPVFGTDLGLLYKADCLELLSALKDDSMDCVFADPPFNLGKIYSNGEISDTREKDEYLLWCFSWIDELMRVVKPGGAISSTFCRNGATIWLSTSKAGRCCSATG